MTGEDTNTPTDRALVSQPRASSPSPAPPTEGSINPTATGSSSPQNRSPTGDTDDQVAETAAAVTSGGSSFEIENQARLSALVAISAAISSSSAEAASQVPRSRRFRRSGNRSRGNRSSRNSSSNRRHPPSPASVQCSSCSRQLCLLMLYPGMVVMTIIGLIVILVFCVLPSLMCLGMVICLYYCCHSDPMPLPILLRRFFDGREDLRVYQPRQDRFDPNSERVKALRSLYRSKLIVRKLLRVETTKGDGDGDGDLDLDSLGFPKTQARDEKFAKINNNDESVLTIDQRSTIDPKSVIDKKLIDERLLRNHKFPIRIRTDHSILYFSAPLEAPANVSDGENGPAKESREVAAGDADGIDSNGNDNDNENENETDNNADLPDFVPHYQRSYDNDDVAEGTEIQADYVARSDEFSSDRETEVEGKNGENAEGGDGERIKNCSMGQLHPEEGFVYVEDVARDPRTVCDICMLEFEVGDEIAWSPNLNCKHSFHKDCILDWLVRKPTCPCCRQDYVNSNAEDNV